jgi:hypothetical protein
MIFFMFYINEIYFKKIKNIYFWIIFLICVTLHNTFLSFILFNQFHMCLILLLLFN